MIFLYNAVIFCQSFGSQVRQDLDCMYQMVQKNHPGAVNKEDRFFMTRMRIAYAQAFFRSYFRVHNEDDYSQVLSIFVRSFNDNHVAVSFTHKKQSVDVKKPKHFTCTEFDHDSVWIALPTFHNLTLEQKDEFDFIYKKLSELRSKKTIIFDLRGNGGGNSQYGSDIANALFGKESSEYVRYFNEKNVAVDWRVSAANKEYLEHLITVLPNISMDLQSIVDGMVKALKDKQDFYREYPQGEVKQFYPSAYTGKVFVITAKENGSVVLDFLDEITVDRGQGKAILLGKETCADTDYMEIRSVDLPSRLAKFHFPIKVYRNRKRKSGQRYIPNYPLNIDMNDDAAVKKEVGLYI